MTFLFTLLKNKKRANILLELKWRPTTSNDEQWMAHNKNNNNNNHNTKRTPYIFTVALKHYIGKAKGLDKHGCFYNIYEEFSFNAQRAFVMRVCVRTVSQTRRTHSVHFGIALFSLCQPLRVPHLEIIFGHISISFGFVSFFLLSNCIENVYFMFVSMAGFTSHSFSLSIDSLKKVK